MKRGDIVLVKLPPPAGPPGREQFGDRPAIVVQEDPLNANLSTVLIVPLTSRLSAAHLPGSFTVSPTHTNGLDVKSVVLSHQLRAIDRRRIQRVIGSLDADAMATLEAEMRRLLGL
ncbi:MAG: type II toxin-antitoxin system PemK/MazF family toxin [Thermoguttaceae bacterium]|nr:type II toxin-antitoxin system PemK/MazF family toxin [Thermoguttaceae bacterium]